MATKITIENLKKAGATYDKQLATIMPALFAEVAKELGIGLYKMTNNQHNLRTYVRKGGLLRPYKYNEELTHVDLGKVDERTLELHHSVIATQDDIAAYADSDAFEPVSSDPAKPKHPLEKTIVFSIAKTMAEDMLDNLFFAEYDPDGSTAITAFDGYFPLVAQGIVDGEIDAAKGNLNALAAEFTAPQDGSDTAAYDNLVEWLQSASPKLLRGKGTRLLMPLSAALYVKQAYANKVKAFSDPEWERVVGAVRASVMAPVLEIVPNQYLGTGSNLILASVVDDTALTQNLVFGYNQDPDKTFLAINNSPSNVNLVYYQSDIKVGAQVRSFNKNVFCTTSGVAANTAPNLSGDE